MEIIDKSKEIKKLISNSSSVYILGHRYLDLDALGSAIGMYEYARTLNKKPIIIINDKKHEKGVARVLEKVANNYNIKRSNTIKNKINDKSLLIVVDTNNKNLIQDPNLIDLFSNILVLDHHDITKDTIDKGLRIIDESSSACEMVSFFLEKNRISINKIVATILLSGIILDTNNYVLKTSANTFRASAFLADLGANPNDVQLLLKQELKDYVARQKVITNAKIYKNIAVSTAKSSISYRREDLAKIADALLLFNNITTSFVIGKLDKNTTGISARSTSDIDVGKVLMNLGGGGNKNEAGARIEKKSIGEVEQELRKTLKNII